MSPATDSTSASASMLRNKTQQEGGAPADAAARKTFSVLGVSVDALQIPEVICRMREWIARRDACHYIAVTGMHGITEARHRLDFKRVLADADLVVPDGMPLVWIGRLRGKSLQRRVYGPELMLSLCRRYIFLYMTFPGIARLAREHLLRHHTENDGSPLAPSPGKNSTSIRGHRRGAGETSHANVRSRRAAYHRAQRGRRRPALV